MNGAYRTKSWFIVALALILVFSTFLPAKAMQSNQEHALTVVNDDFPEVQVDQELQKEFKENEFVTYIVKMKEQLNVEKAVHQAKLMSAVKGESMAKEKESVRHFIVSSLQETSDRTQESLLDFLKKNQKDIKDYYSFYIINALEVTSTKKVMEMIAKRPDVEKITFNRTHTLDEEVLKKEDSLHKTVGTNHDIPWNLSNINIPEVWAKGYDGTGITVANMDSGVDYTHPALRNQWRGMIDGKETSNPEAHWKDVTAEATKLPTDGNGHGTHVMGTMVGQEPNGLNKIGVAPNAKWIAVKIFDSEGKTTDGEVLRGGEWILAPGGDANLAPDVVNNSWGSVAPGKEEYFREVVKRWKAANIVPIFSAGNVRYPSNTGGSGSVTAPANYPESFSVGAVDKGNQLGDFSLQGPSPYGDQKPEVSAPGVQVRSAVPGGGYVSLNGTSMASPHVAGIAALLLQQNSSLRVEEVEQILKDTAVPLTDRKFPKSPNNGYGHGIVNALNAIASQEESGIGMVKGTVTTAGVDDSSPTIQHKQIAWTSNILPQDIYARATDENGITNVKLFVRENGKDEWQTFPMNLLEGDKLEGEYEGNIPVEHLSLDGIEYYLQAKDYSGNITTTEAYQLIVSEGVKKGYKQDFEENLNGFDYGGDKTVWEWGVPTSGPQKAYSGEKVIATTLGGNYREGSEGFFVLPLMDLREEKTPTVLSFAHWYRLGHFMFAEWDRAEVYVGTKVENEEKFNFELVKSYTLSQREWANAKIDLTPYNGQQIYVIFNLRGNFGSAEGWYIDDIELTDPDPSLPDSPKVSVRSNTPGRIIVQWTKLKNEDVKEYVIYRSQDPDEDFTEIGTSSGTNYGDVPLEQKGTYFYYVKARTYAGTLSEPSNIVSWTFTGGEEIYSNDFEGSVEDWTVVEGSDWEHGKPDPSKGAKKAISGKNVWGTNLSDYYKGDVEHSLISPTIDLTNAKHASVYFQQWYGMDDYIGEKGYVDISNDGGETWHTLTSYPKEKYDVNHPRKFWYLEELNIDDYVSEKINIRFRLDSKNKNILDYGWFIDDFQVRDTPAVKTRITSTATEDVIETNQSQEIQTMIQNETVPVWEAIIKNRRLNQLDGSKTSSGVLPVSATLTILETNRSTKAEHGSGEFFMKHPKGDYTLRAEAYGYKSTEQKIHIEKDHATVADINLEALPKGVIKGKIIDHKTGEPIIGAYVRVMEDTKVPAVLTNEQGEFVLTIYAGKYHLVASANGYMAEDEIIEITGTDPLEKVISLKAYKAGEEQELGYDDDSGENAKSLPLAAVRITTNGPAQVTEGRFYFYDKGWPKPGGEDFRYAVYAADGEDGAPGTLLSGPFNGKARTDGQWTKLALPNPVIIEGDFYIVYIQSGTYPNVPGISIDKDGEFTDRSWAGSEYNWKKHTNTEGNFMIRAAVKPALEKPGEDTPVTKINAQPSSLELKVNERSSIHVTGTIFSKEGVESTIPLTKGVTFTSLDKKIATVDENGEVKAIAKGNTSIDIRYKELTATVSVTVVAATDTKPTPNPDPIEYPTTIPKSDSKPQPNDKLKDIEGHWAQKEIEYALNKKWISGYQDSTFRPQAKMNREHFAIIMARVLDLKGEGSPLHFTDQQKITASSQKAIAQVVEAGIIKGYPDGSFQPAKEITRLEMAIIIARAIGLQDYNIQNTGFADDSSIPSWAKSHLSTLKGMGIIQGRHSNQFDPQASVSRAESVVMLTRMDKWFTK